MIKALGKCFLAKKTATKHFHTTLVMTGARLFLCRCPASHSYCGLPRWHRGFQHHKTHQILPRCVSHLWTNILATFELCGLKTTWKNLGLFFSQSNTQLCAPVKLQFPSNSSHTETALTQTIKQHMTWLRTWLHYFKLWMLLQRSSECLTCTFNAQTPNFEGTTSVKDHSHPPLLLRFGAKWWRKVFFSRTLFHDVHSTFWIEFIVSC